MSAEYSEEKILTDLLDEVIQNNGLPELAPLHQNAKILACFAIKTNKKGEAEEGEGEPVVLKKVPDPLRIFIKNKAQYVIVADFAWWEGAIKKARMAHLFNALTGIEVKTDAKAVKLKVIAAPGIRAQTLVRFGAYDAASAAIMEACRNEAGRLRMEDLIMVAEHALGGQAPQEAEEEEEPPRVRTQQEVEAAVNDKAAENDAVETDEPKLPTPKLPKGIGKKR
jgi:hypothetical protein